MERTERKVQERTTPAGARLYALRVKRGWTMEEAGKHWGINRETLRRYERGIELIKSDKAIRIARSEGVTLDWLYAMDVQTGAVPS